MTVRRHKTSPGLVDSPKTECYTSVDTDCMEFRGGVMDG